MAAGEVGEVVVDFSGLFQDIVDFLNLLRDLFCEASHVVCQYYGIWAGVLLFFALVCVCQKFAFSEVALTAEKFRMELSFTRQQQ